MTPSQKRGVWLMVAAVFCFAAQDGFSRHLAGDYNTLMVVMIRYWVFAAFVVTLAWRRPEGVRAAVQTRRPMTQVIRAVLLVTEVCLIVWGYTLIGLIESHAVFAVCPLLVAALSGPILGERVSWQRWAAIGAGMVGVIIILRPGSGVFTPAALLPFAAALMFALYSILTRLTARDEAVFPSLFWSATIGAVLMTIVGLPQWEAVTSRDWIFLGLYAGLSILSHWLLIKCYEITEAAQVQPFAYLQIVFVSIIGLVVFDETLDPAVAVGAAIVIAAGLFALLNQKAPPVAGADGG